MKEEVEEIKRLFLVRKPRRYVPRTLREAVKMGLLKTKIRKGEKL